MHVPTSMQLDMSSRVYSVCTNANVHVHMITEKSLCCRTNVTITCNDYIYKLLLKSLLVRVK